METNDLSMDMKHGSSKPMKIQGENDGFWSRWVKTAVGSCVLCCSHVKGKPLSEVTTKEGQARSLRYEVRAVQEDSTRCEIETTHGSRSNLMKVYEGKRAIGDLKQGKDELIQLVGKLKCLWSELDELRSNRSDPEGVQERLKQDGVFSLLGSLKSTYDQLIRCILSGDELSDVDGECVIVQKGEDHHMLEKNKKPMCMKHGTSCKKGRLRRIFRAKRAKGLYQKRSRQSGGLSNSLEMRWIKEFMQQTIRGECSYSAYMGNSVEERMVVRGQETKGADDPITKKE